MSSVLVFGTFDALHPGHDYFLEHAHSYGKKLIVVVARDSFVKTFKSKSAVHDEEYRLNSIRNHPLVSEAYLADSSPGQFTILTRVETDIICLGHDQDDLEQSLKEWMRENSLRIKIKKLKPYKRHKYSSTLLNRMKHPFRSES